MKVTHTWVGNIFAGKNLQETLKYFSLYEENALSFIALLNFAVSSNVTSVLY